MLQEESLQIREAMKVTKYRQITETFADITILPETDLTDLIAKLLEKMVKALNAEAGTLWYYDRNGDGYIHAKGAYGGTEISNFYLKPGEGVAGSVVETGESTLISDCQKDSRWAGKVDKNTGFRTESMICVPVFIGEDIFGCIQVINKVERELFDKQDLKFAESLAAYISEMLTSAPKEVLMQYNFYYSDWDEFTTFAAVFHHSNGMPMRSALRAMKEVQALNLIEREAVLYHAEKIRKILNKKEQEDGKGKKQDEQ